MAKISDFTLSTRQLVHLAIDKQRNGDIISAARYARDAIKANQSAGMAYSVLACLFSDDNEFELANKTLFKALHETRDYDNRRFKRLLVINYLHLEMPDVAVYYSTDQEDEVLETVDNIIDEIEQRERTPDLYLSYPLGKEYYERIISKAYRCAHDGDMSGAFKLVDGLPDDGGDVVAKAKLMLHSMNNDVNAVISYGERLLKEGRDTTTVRCTLASAYLMKERVDDAYEVAKPLLDEKNGDLESMFMVLPIAVSLNRHSDIIRIIKKVSSQKGLRCSKRLMIWYAQALYNIGQPEAARAVMTDVNTYYGEDAPAFYYLDLFSQQPEKVEYSLILPKGGHVRNMGKIREILTMSDDDLAVFDKTHTAVGDNLEYYVHWAFSNSAIGLHNAMISRLVYYKRAKEIFESCLISGELNYGLMSSIIDSLEFTNDGLKPLEFDIVVQDRFKHIKFTLPRALLSLPSTLMSAVRLSITDIIFTDEEPNIYLERLTQMVNGIVDLNSDGKVVYSNKSRERLSTVRSADTLVGVFLGKVYEEEENRESVIERYGLNPKLYDKYSKIVFGDDDGQR